MARLVPVKCPNCGANVRIDPDRDIATCSYCRTSSFVQTPTRRLSEEARDQNPMVFDVAAYQSSLRLSATLVWIGAAVTFAVGAVAVVVSLSYQARRATLARKTQVLAAQPQESERAAAAPALDASVSLGKPPKLSVGKVTVTGRLDADAVQKVVRRHHNRFGLCHQRTVRPGVDAYGTLTMRFVIGRDGGVSNAEIGSSTVPSSAFTTCVQEAFAGMLFPRPPGGIVTVVYPLVVEQG